MRDTGESDAVGALVSALVTKIRTSDAADACYCMLLVCKA